MTFELSDVELPQCGTSSRSACSPRSDAAKEELAPEKELTNEQHIRKDRCDRRCRGGTSDCGCSTYSGRSRTKRRVCSRGSSRGPGRRCVGRRICRVPILWLSGIWRL